MGTTSQGGSKMSDEVTPFRIGIPQADQDDLRERLVRARWPEAETVADWLGSLS